MTIRNFQSANYTPPPDEELKRQYKGFGLSKFEGLDSVASLRQYAQVVETLPEWVDDTDIGRLIYTIDTGQFFYGGINESWNELAQGASINVQTGTLVAGDITNKYVTLASEPAVPQRTILMIAGAPSLQYGIHFTVSGNQLGWNGLGLDGIVLSGDQITVIYF